MARPTRILTRPSTTTVADTGALVAASELLNTRVSGGIGGDRYKANITDDSWKKRAWEFFAEVPEVRFSATWIGDAMSRALLVPKIRRPNGTIEDAPDGSNTAEAVHGIAGGPGGQAQMLGGFGRHLTVAGEGFLIVDEPDNEPARWHVLSVLEVQYRNGRWTAVLDGKKREWRDDPNCEDCPTVIRIWQPNPARRLEADSPIRSSFPILEELDLLRKAVSSTAKSRLRGRGVFAVPQGSSLPVGPDGKPRSLMRQFIEAAEIATRDPDSAAAAVPIVIEVPMGEGNVRPELFKFESDFDQLAVTLREEAIRRYATGMDIPAEVLLGTGDINHWGQWQIEESAIRLAIEPRLTLVCDALTDQFLTPWLEELGDRDAGRAFIWYDTSPLRVRSNRSQTAIELNKANVINDEATRRETGFSDEDAPTPEEEHRDLLIELLRALPSLAPTILPLLGIELPDEIEAEGGGRITIAPDPAEDSEAELPIDEDPGPPNPDDTPDEPALAVVSDGLVAACDGLVWRALEVAGNRLRSRRPRSERGRLQHITASSMHVEVTVADDEIDSWNLLAGAWERVPDVADRYNVDPDCLANTLDVYTRQLLLAGVEHCFRQVPAALDTECLAVAA